MSQISSPFWWWLSFCDANRPEGEQLLGVAIVDALTIEDAISRARYLGCNPGGEVALLPLDAAPPESYRRRLLKPDEAKIASVLCVSA